MDDFFVSSALTPVAEEPGTEHADVSPVPAEVGRSPYTRWEGTATTFGPWVKGGLTVVALLLGYWMSWVPSLFAPLRFITVPAMCVLEWVFLRSMWQRGRR